MNGKQLAVSLGGMLIKVVLAIIIVALLYKASLFFYDFGYRVFHDSAIDANGGKEVTVAIVEGKSVKEVGKILKDKGLIRNEYLFVLQEMFSGKHGDMKPGVFTLSTAMTPKEMILIMAAEPDTTNTGETTPADTATPNPDDTTEPVDTTIPQDGATEGDTE